MLRPPDARSFFVGVRVAFLIDWSFWKSTLVNENENSRCMSAVPVLAWGVRSLYQGCASGAYIGIPSSFMRARVSSFEATRRGTFFLTKRVMSVSTPNFIRAYLANCL